MHWVAVLAFLCERAFAAGDETPPFLGMVTVGLLLTALTYIVFVPTRGLIRILLRLVRLT
ncbi:hypothetical protein ASF26_19440 [Methylobacterium sp. Leaf93]|nr:hypothetical protein ASF26_19440 [Methylobacterium sp. Leaf93]